MLRSLILAAACSAAVHGQIWPESWHGSARTKVGPAPVEDRMLWVEAAGEASEAAVYDGPVGKFSAIAWRLRDATSALAWYQANRPPNCTPARGSMTLCNTPGVQVQVVMNYVLRFEGWRPLPKEMQELEAALPRLRSGGGLPLLAGYLPEQGRLRGSERYILGLHSLQTVLPAFPPTLAGFEDGAEAQYGKIRAGASEVDVAIFYFHTPQLARVKTAEFEKQPGWLVKRSGPLVGVIPGGAANGAAQAILGPLEWKAEVIRNTPGSLPPMPNVAGMLIAIFELTGLLLAVCVGGGSLFAGVWVYLRQRRMRLAGHDQEMTVLQLRE